MGIFRLLAIFPFYRHITTSPAVFVKVSRPSFFSGVEEVLLVLSRKLATSLANAGGAEVVVVVFRNISSTSANPERQFSFLPSPKFYFLSVLRRINTKILLFCLFFPAAVTSSIPSPLCSRQGEGFVLPQPQISSTEDRAVVKIYYTVSLRHQILADSESAKNLF